jgi:hypothetical protein
MNLTKGTEIYYNGDMANNFGFGKIIKIKQKIEKKEYMTAFKELKKIK